MVNGAWQDKIGRMLDSIYMIYDEHVSRLSFIHHAMNKMKIPIRIQPPNI